MTQPIQHLQGLGCPLPLTNVDTDQLIPARFMKTPRSAGYGHFLLHVDQLTSKAIEQKILEGCLMERPGWIRMSIHPTMTNAEIEFICDAIKEVAKNFKEWQKEYTYNAIKNEFITTIKSLFT